MTKRDKKLLLFLAAFLVGAGFLSWVVLPAAGQMNELNMQISELKSTKKVMEEKIDGLGTIRTLYEKEQQEWQEAAMDFYPLLKSQEIDRMLTEMVFSNGLLVRELKIAMPDKEAEFIPYRDGQTASAKEDVEEEVTLQKETLEEEPLDTQTEAEEAIKVYEAEITIIIKGNKEQRQKLIDHLCGYPALRITGYEAVIDSGNSESDLLRIGVALYMCDKEGVKERE